APVAIHRVVAAADRGQARPAALRQHLFERAKVVAQPGGRRVAAIRNDVYEDARQPAFPRLRHEREDMRLVTVDAAIGEQADEVQRPAAHAVERRLERRIDCHRALADGLVDAREVLIDDAAGPHVHVADLRVAHLTRGQADGLARRLQPRHREARQQLVVVRRAGHRDRVVRGCVAQAPAVEDDECERTPGHHRSGFRAARPAYAAVAPSASSMRSSWLYLAVRSERLADPVFIWPEPVATARSAIVVSSVSPERCEITDAWPAARAISTASSVSVTVPI